MVKVAKANSYVETLGTHADSLHCWIRKLDEKDFRLAFEKQVRKAIKNLNVNYARLAFDITTEPFYGKTRNLYVFDTPERNPGGEFKFMTVCLITRNNLKDSQIQDFYILLNQPTRDIQGLSDRVQLITQGKLYWVERHSAKTLPLSTFVIRA